MPVYAVDTGVLPGSHGAAVSGPSGITSPADSGFEQSGEPAQGEARARSKPDWLTIPPDPARHNLWVPSAEWATCLALTIPLFMLAPSFVHTGTAGQSVRRSVDPTPGVGHRRHRGNYVLHPIMGAEAYLTVRNRDYGRSRAPVLNRRLRRVGVPVRGVAERPSAQDLLITSNIGSLQGGLRFQIRRGSRGGVRRWDATRC